MAISQRTRTLGTAASGAGFTVTFPTGSTTGDRILLVVVNSSTTSPAVPTGWASIYSASGVTVYSAPWSAGLTGSFTNAASVAAWACQAYSSSTGNQVDVDATTAATNTTNNTTLPVGNPTVGGIGGCYEALFYGWTSNATISTPATGTTIDGTQANSTTVSAATGHNNTTSLAAGTVLALGNATLSGSNNRKAGVGVILRDSRNVQRTATPVTASLADIRRRGRVSWVDMFVPLPAVRTATPVTAALQSTLTRTATPVTVSLQVPVLSRTATPVTASLSSASLTRTATPVTVALRSTLTRTATPVTASVSVTGNTRTATPITVALQSSLTRTATPVTVSLSGQPRRGRVSWVLFRTPDPLTPSQRVASPVTVALRGTVTRSASPITVSMSGASPFINAVSADGRSMVDQFGQPYLIQGDSPQCMPAKLTATQIGQFFASEATRGINSSQIHLVLADGGGMGGNPGGVDVNGNPPFSNMSSLSGPNAAYWAAIDTMFDLAASNGITIWATAVDNISMQGTIAAMTTAQCRTLGQFLGNRYKTRPNLIWQFGNDWQDYPSKDAQYQALLQGIRDTGDTHLVSLWLNYLDSTSWDLSTWDSLHQVVLAYTYHLPWTEIEIGYTDASPTAPQPIHFGEGNYESEHNWSFGGITTTTNETLRRTHWGTVTWGACGNFFGQGTVWNFNDTFSNILLKINSTAAQEFARIKPLITSLQNWQTLRPDLSHALITSGFGTHDMSQSTDPLLNNFATAAMTTDKRVAVIYVPTVRSWVIEPTAMVGTLRGFWFDPTTGTRTTATSPWTIPAAAHADGTHDWVLVLQASSGTASPVTVSLIRSPQRVATPVTVSLTATPPRTASPVSVALQSLTVTRTGTPVAAALASSDLRRQASPVTVALATAGTRTATPVSVALAASNVRRTATPITAAVLTSFLRSALPVTAALQTADAPRTATPITAALGLVRGASPVTVALQAARLGTPVSVALSTIVLSRTATPVTVALASSALQRTATPTTVALQTVDAQHLANPISVALSSLLARVASPVDASVTGGATARLGTPVTAALSSQLERDATGLTVALLTSTPRVGTPTTVALMRQRIARTVTASVSTIARTNIAHPVSVSLEGAAGPPAVRALTVLGRDMELTTNPRSTTLTVKGEISR